MTLPTGWTLVTIGETGDYINGYAFKPEHWSAKGKPIIRIQNLTNPDREPHRTEFEAPPGVQVSPGDLLVSWSATLDAFIWRGEAAVLNQHIFRVVPNDQLLEPRLLYHWLRLAIAELSASVHAHGSTMAHINRGPFLAHRLPLPPLNEQRRIAEALDELLTDLASAEADLTAAKRKLALYRQSLLKSAVEGTLTADWRQRARTRETGADLHARLLGERRARWEARQLARFKAQGKSAPKDWRERFDPGTAPDTANLPELPDRWVYASLGQCFEVAVGATPSRKSAEYWGGGVPWVSSGEVSFNRITTTRESISDSGLANSSTQINPAGSVLLGMIGEGKTRGQVAILDIPAANNQNCAAIWVSETDVPPEFVYYWLWSRYDETRRSSSGNNQPALNKSLVQAMPVPIAPVEEMREIAERVSVQFAGIEAQEREIDRLLRMATAQRQNILRTAFSGQLVPQDPNDEPASVLLERIRAQRPASAAKAKRKPGRPAKVAA